MAGIIFLPAPPLLPLPAFAHGACALLPSRDSSRTVMAEPASLVLLAIYFGAVVGLVGLMLGLSHVLGQRHSAPATVQPYESGMVPVGDAHLRFPAQFYLIAMFFVVFDLEVVFIYAWAIAAREAGWAGYVEMLIFVAILAAALAYLWGVGALDWAPRRRRPSERG
jgi:NADH-quinone oxidoreductase subunit A